jgi:hypothetical protein
MTFLGNAGARKWLANQTVNATTSISGTEKIIILRLNTRFWRLRRNEVLVLAIGRFSENVGGPSSVSANSGMAGRYQFMAAVLQQSTNDKLDVFNQDSRRRNFFSRVC